jgi:rod shape-determining protein MreB
MDDSIIQYVKKEYSLMLGERTSEAIKVTIGSAFPTPDEMLAEIKGRDLVSGLPKTIHITAEEVRKAMEEPVNAIIDAVKNTLDRCPPELAADIMDRGIVLTGGGALLKGLDERLKHETGMPIHVAENPLHCVANGSGKCLEEFEVLKRVLISSGRR